MFGLVLLNVVGLGGCHHSASLLDNSQFMEAWHTYLLCRGSAEPEEIRVDLQRINVLSGRHAESLRNHSSILLLPIAMRSLVAPLPSRIVVDPQAMATACALHAGHVAHSAERPEFSVELLTGVLTPREGSPTAILPFSLVLGSSARNRALISRGGHRTHDPSDSGR
ncbi:MAG: hypothetical protein K0S58_2738 [Nitrospira sp.]|nr:hypothetical protein [Nitrospira sp.]